MKHCDELLCEEFPFTNTTAAVKNLEILRRAGYQASIEVTGGDHRRHGNAALGSQVPSQGTDSHAPGKNGSWVPGNTSKSVLSHCSTAPLGSDEEDRSSCQSGRDDPFLKWLVYCLPRPDDPENTYSHHHWRAQDGCVCEMKVIAAMKQMLKGQRSFFARNFMWRDVTNIALSQVSHRATANILHTYHNTNAHHSSRFDACCPQAATVQGLMATQSI